MFKGPVFIIGRPRSGTKLLRELLNRHSCISIPFWESNIIPHYAMKAKSIGNLENRENLSTLIDWLSDTEFYRKITGDQGYPGLDKNMWLSSITDFSYPGVISALFTLYASFEGKNVWGDKSPDYMLHLPVLKEMFPEAKFIHIIRDVRDVCLSLVKSWGLHPVRGAQQWVDSIVKCRNDARRSVPGDYLEIRYESLLQNTKRDLLKVCDFLQLEFEDAMTTLTRAVGGRFGDAQDATDIVSSNMEKWRYSLSPRLIEQIEKISIHLMQDLGSSVVYAKRQTRISSTELLFFRGIDAWNWFKRDRRREGSITRGLVRQYRKRRFG